jgi:hypothetical protein
MPVGIPIDTQGLITEGSQLVAVVDNEIRKHLPLD